VELLRPASLNSARSPKPKKKPYRRPKLTVYGNLAEITRTNSEIGAADGGVVVGMRRTG